MAVGQFLVLTLLSSVSGARTFYKTGNVVMGVADGTVFAAAFSVTNWYLS